MDNCVVPCKVNHNPLGVVVPIAIFSKEFIIIFRVLVDILPFAFSIILEKVLSIEKLLASLPPRAVPPRVIQAVYVELFLI